MNIDEVYDVSTTMKQYGGSFVEALGEALSCADRINQQKIKEAFPEYWKQYLDIAEIIKKIIKNKEKKQ